MAATMRGEIVFENVTFAYGDDRGGGEPVLTDVSFSVRPGETVAIVGETGSGTSALVKLVPRICDVSAGRILIDGVDVREWNPRASLGSGCWRPNGPRLAVRV